ncbi:hypothetical protein AC481_02890 [miscellaneous Crenarchaeota group archaeon SMTZ-80]|nr:MAG: hypothetical protein AC481_02890 [miscellaneous Crenarchaeota group archaeon SMTZ-80]
MSKCPNCSKRNAKKSNFCYACGKSLKTESGVPKPMPSVKVITPLDLDTSSSYDIDQSTQIMRPNTERPGMCYYHPDLPAMYICGRCNKTICLNCGRPYGQLILCPQCYSVPYAPIFY